jgi:hypothetical protein
MLLVCSKPGATGLAFNFATFPFVINLVLKIHLLVICLCKQVGPIVSKFDSSLLNHIFVVWLLTTLDQLLIFHM